MAKAGWLAFILVISIHATDLDALLESAEDEAIARTVVSATGDTVDIDDERAVVGTRVSNLGHLRYSSTLRCLEPRIGRGGRKTCGSGPMSAGRAF